MADFTSLEEGSKKAFLTTLAHARFRIAGGHDQNICKEELTMVNVALIFNKQFPAKGALDTELMKLMTHGIVQKWYRFFVNREYRIFKKDSDRATNEPTVLQFHHLEGVFITGFAGLAISCTAFAIEVLFALFNSRKRNFSCYQ